MRAKDLLDANQLSAAIVELNQEVKQHPADPRLRTFLFELLCFDGAYERAERQLDVLGNQDEKTGIGIAVYRNLLRAEHARRRLFSEGVSPTFLSDPSEHMRASLDAILQLREGNAATAKSLIERAQALQPSLNGTMNGQRFSQFRDSDDRFGPVIEAFINNTYVWIAIESVKSLVLSAPSYLRDLMWMPAKLECQGGEGGDAFLPVLYAGSEQDENEQVRLGRMTEWVALGEGLVGGVGQKTFLVDGGERALLEIRELMIDPPSA